MYTYEKLPLTEEGYEILDPDGILICYVYTENEAQALISHLNRE